MLRKNIRQLFEDGTYSKRCPWLNRNGFFHRDENASQGLNTAEWVIWNKLFHKIDVTPCFNDAEKAELQAFDTVEKTCKREYALYPGEGQATKYDAKWHDTALVAILRGRRLDNLEPQKNQQLFLTRQMLFNSLVERYNRLTEDSQSDWAPYQKIRDGILRQLETQRSGFDGGSTIHSSLTGILEKLKRCRQIKIEYNDQTIIPFPHNPSETPKGFELIYDRARKKQLSILANRICMLEKGILYSVLDLDQQALSTESREAHILHFVKQCIVERYELTLQNEKAKLIDILSGFELWNVQAKNMLDWWEDDARRKDYIDKVTINWRNVVAKKILTEEKQVIKKYYYTAESFAKNLPEVWYRGHDEKNGHKQDISKVFSRKYEKMKEPSAKGKAASFDYVWYCVEEATERGGKLMDTVDSAILGRFAHNDEAQIMLRAICKVKCINTKGLYPSGKPNYFELYEKYKELAIKRFAKSTNDVLKCGDEVEGHLEQVIRQELWKMTHRS